jgi:hypothetical protein
MLEYEFSIAAKSAKRQKLDLDESILERPIVEEI